ncbi:enoyl-CoA hydratase [Diaporthe helianthi]|uniref:Enoyl-CoA hydratase n=1 Tax=Diaporthe helianthi TaxID=158607 RepID=A0A2P5IFL2_DIAHE|nr:enoyl-CoA hydratase [Diaporthe helianthi]
MGETHNKYQSPEPSPSRPHDAPGNSGQNDSLRSQPLKFKHFRVTFPQEKVVLVTLTRTDKLNCIDKATSREIAGIWEAFDQDESLLVGVITGEGRAFCTGADLHEWNEMNRNGVVNDMGPPGLAGLPRRGGKKPIIAAVNGICMGGGFEMAANCDIVIAASSATFALSEVRRGIVPVAGSLPRLASTIGLQRTMELALTGRGVGAATLHAWGLVSQVVEDGGDNDVVVAAALRLAGEICSNSPDAVIVGRLGIRMAWETGNVEEAVTALAEQWYPRLVKGANFAEGIQAFAEKRPPKWVGSKL